MGDLSSTNSTLFFLVYLPVHAQPDRLTYRLRKFAVRYRVPVVVSSMLLAVIVAVDSYSTMLMWRLLINRFKLLNKVESSDGLQSISPQALIRLESATADSFAGLHSCWLLALVSVAFFWSIFVFDMVGDVYGAEAGGLSVLGPSLILLCVGVVPVLLRRLRKKEINILSSQSCNIEMNTVSPMAPSVVVDVNTEMNSEYL